MSSSVTNQEKDFVHLIQFVLSVSLKKTSD